MFLRYAWSKTAAAVPLDPALDEEPEVQEAEVELYNTSRGPQRDYWEYIQERLFDKSTNKTDIKEAVAEWYEVESWIGQEGQCALCDFHPIKFHFKIANRTNRNTFVVGSECIVNYLRLRSERDVELLRKQVQQTKHRLRLLKEGLPADPKARDLAVIQQLERVLYQRIPEIAKPENDFNPREALETLDPPVKLGNVLGLKGSAFDSCTAVQNALKKLIVFLDSLANRSKTYNGVALIGAVDAIMRLRVDDGEKKELLATLKGFVNHIGNAGSLSAVVNRAWDEVKDGRGDIVESYQKDLAKAHAAIDGEYDAILTSIKRYEKLYFLVSVGVNQTKTAMTEKVQKAMTTVLSDKFVELATDDPMVINALKPALPKQMQTDSGNYNIQWGIEAVQVIQAIRYPTGKLANTKVGKTLRWMFNVEPTESEYKQLFLECLDEHVVDPDALSKVDAELSAKINNKDPEALKVIRTVLPNLMREGAPLHELISADIGVDIEKVFNRMDPDNDFERQTCVDLVSQWQSGSRKKPNAKMLGVLKKKLNVRESKNPSMWDVLKSDLLDTSYGTYRR